MTPSEHQKGADDAVSPEPEPAGSGSAPGLLANADLSRHDLETAQHNAVHANQIAGLGCGTWGWGMCGELQHTTSTGPAGSTCGLHLQLELLQLFLPYKPALFVSLISFLFLEPLPPSSRRALLPLTQPKAAKAVGAPPAYPPFLMANPPPLHMCPSPATSTYQVGPPGCGRWTTAAPTSSSFRQVFSPCAGLSVPPGPVDTPPHPAVWLTSFEVRFGPV